MSVFNTVILPHAGVMPSAWRKARPLKKPSLSAQNGLTTGDSMIVLASAGLTEVMGSYINVLFEW